MTLLFLDHVWHGSKWLGLLTTVSGKDGVGQTKKKIMASTAPKTTSTITMWMSKLSQTLTVITHLGD